MPTLRGRTAPAVLQQGQWATRTGCRQVLAIAHTVPYAQRLREVVELLEPDLRIQVVFTVAPHAFGAGVARHLRETGFEVVPWKQAAGAGFDLALAAGSQGIDQVRAPVLRMPHGAVTSSFCARSPAGRTARPRRTARHAFRAC
ncbi:hypothetical protein [Streptomyces carminius]|uniref:hypothetical protein n=1 Tax=Streptomyces carminius TaxID=2665496 RepID=UPI002FCDFCA2